MWNRKRVKAKSLMTISLGSRKINISVSHYIFIEINFIIINAILSMHKAKK